MSEKTKIQLFQEKSVRTHWDDKNEKWYFSIIDVVAILTEQKDYQGARNYWKVLKHRLLKEGNETVTNCNRLKLIATDDKMRMTDVADTDQLFRLIQSIPSPKAEPFKLWLAKVGSERINEIEDPELAFERAMETYLKKDISCGAKALIFCYSVNPTLKDGVISIWSKARLILRSINFAVNNTVINLFKKLSQTYFNVVENKHNYPSIYAGD